MSKNIKEVLEELNKLNISIESILKDTGFEYYEEPSNVDIDEENEEELFLMDELYKLLTKLYDASSIINYLNKPVMVEGKMHKKTNGRYEVNGIELSSGYCLEYLCCDERHCRYNENNEYVPTPYWKSGRIEHNGKNYYIVGAPELDELENLHVRLKK